MTAFKRGDRRASYDALRSLVVTATEKKIPSFDECVVDIAICDAQVCCSISGILFKIPFSAPSHGGNSAASNWPDGAQGLGKTEHVSQFEEEQHRQQQQQNPWGISAPSLVAWDAGLGLGGMESDRETAAGSGPRNSSTGASDLGLVGEQQGGGRRWSGQRGEEAFRDKHTPGTAIDERKAGEGGECGVRSMCRYLPLVSHQPHERSGQPVPYLFGDLGPGSRSFCHEATAQVQHRHDLLCAPDDHQQARSPSLPAAGVSVPKKVHYPPRLRDYPRRCEAARNETASRHNSDRAAIGGSIGIRNSGSDSVPVRGGQKGKEPLVANRSGLQPLSYDGGQRSGGGGENANDGGAAAFSDLIDLLLDD